MFNNLSRGGIDWCFLLQPENTSWHLYIYNAYPIITFLIIYMEVAYCYGNYRS